MRRFSSSSGPPLPTFLIIGAQKSATRWLRNNLGRHPEIFTAGKELMFWNYGRPYRELGLDWYRAQFSDWAGEPIVGEATPGYMMWRHKPRVVANRMQEHIPEVKLIAILRNPVDRANSAMVHHIKRNRLPADVPLLEVVQSGRPEWEWLGLVSGGWYAQSLRPFRNVFRDQLLILFHDDVRTDPRGVYEKALRHVGADPGFVPDELEQIVFSNQEGDEPGRRKEPRDISPEDRRELYEYFRADIRVLRHMTGRDLSMWNPPTLPKPRVTGTPVERPVLRRRDLTQFLRRYDVATEWVATILENAPVRDELFQQLVGDLREHAVALRHGEGADTAPPNVLGIDPLDIYRRAVQDFRVALTEENASPGPVISPFGVVAPSMFVRYVVFDQLALGWNLAAETGQDAMIPDELLRLAEAFTRMFADEGMDDGTEFGGSPRGRFVEFLYRHLAA